MTEPTDAELWQLHMQMPGAHKNPIDFARAVLAKWGTQPQAGAVPQGWKAVPVNPTPEMWKAAKTVPDPNPPYPPHHGLVWDAMLAASPTPPAEQQAQPGAVGRTGCTAGTDEECTRRGCATSCPAQQAAPKAAPGDASDEAMRERDDAEDFINELLDEVLGADRPEWSNLYGRADALNDVQERMTALHKPAVDKAWGQFQSAMAAPQPVVREPLTDEQLAEMIRDTWGCASIAPRHAMGFARAIERAHGITQNGGD